MRYYYIISHIVKKFICLLSLFFCVLALQGQERTPQTKVEVKTQELVPVWKLLSNVKSETTLFARLYRRPNTRIKKALAFKTLRSRPEMA